jgi:hypothetical protein
MPPTRSYEKKKVILHMSLGCREVSLALVASRDKVVGANIDLILVALVDKARNHHFG